MKTPLWITPALLLVAAACGSETAATPPSDPGPTPGATAAPEPDAIVEEPLPTPEEAAAEAAEAIDAANADAELERLQKELGGGG